MKFGSLFAGIRGFDLALTRAGMESLYAVEREADCNSVARRHFPEEKQFDDVTTFRGRRFSGRCDLVCAGWPCQGNSVAGRRGGMADERSGLWWEVVRILSEQRPRWFLGENVPGLLSVNGGRDFGAILGALAKLGYGFAYRILDAQWFGVPQRRRRVFIVGYLGDWRRPAEILFEREGMPWHPAPRRPAKSRVAASLTRGADSSGRGGYAGQRREDDYNVISGEDVANKIDSRHSPNGHGARGISLHDTLVVDEIAYPMHTRQGNRDGDSQATLIAYSIQGANSNAKANHAISTDVARCLDGSNPEANQGGTVVAYQCHGSNVGPMGTLRAGNGCETGGAPFISGPMRGVRRLMPIECERLQGFPDEWTRYGADGEEISDAARYRMLGNAVAVPAVEWIARRIFQMENRQDASFESQKE